MSYKPHLDFDKALLHTSQASRHRRYLLVVGAILISVYLLLIASGTHVSRQQLSSAIATTYSSWREPDSSLSAAEIAAAEEAEIGSAAPFPASLVKIPETKPGPSADQIVLVMASDDKGNQGNPILHLHERAYENRKEYADWHGTSSLHRPNISNHITSSSLPLSQATPSSTTTSTTSPSLPTSTPSGRKSPPSNAPSSPTQPQNGSSGLTSTLSL